MPTAHRLLDRLRDSFSFRSQLCDGCQSWDDPRYAFRVRASEGKTQRYMPLEELINKKGCVLCEVISKLVLQKWHLLETPNEVPVLNVRPLRAVPVEPRFVQEWRNPTLPSDVASVCKKGGPIKCVLYVHVHEGADVPNQPVEDVDGLRWWLRQDILPAPLLLFYKKFPTHLYRIDYWDTPFFDIQLVKKWLRFCEDEHKDQCCNSLGTLPSGFRLIDVQDACITDAPQSPTFVALSYMWKGNTDEKDIQLNRFNADRLQRPGSLRKSVLPAIIADSMQLCHELGQRYLWVDRLCIVQDDSSSKQIQIDAMHTIYGMAKVTICAAVDGTHTCGLPGVRDRPRRSFLHHHTRQPYLPLGAVIIRSNFDVTVDGSEWNTRLWTFQERILSRRRLYITDYQVYFECGQGRFEEESNPHQFRHSESGGIIADFTVSRYLSDVQDYTRRKFTFESDVLNAFKGLSNKASVELQAPFLFGLPEKHLLPTMLWRSTERLKRREGVPEIPSWSWAAWSGPVTYGDYLPLAFGSMTEFYLHDPECGLRWLSIEETWFGETKAFSSLDNDSRLRPSYTVPTISESTSIWRSCPQNPWNSPSRQPFSPQTCDLARMHPGCLVFNTTIASVYVLSGTHKTLEKDDWHIRGRNREKHCDLLDEDLHKIGYVVVSLEWTAGRSGNLGKYVCIVLCAGILSKGNWASRSEETLPTGALETDVWGLKVLIVEQRGGVSYRVGIGSVVTSLWHQAKPSWDTIVLA